MRRYVQAWDIYLDGVFFDTVYYDTDCDKQYVYDSLVNHDGYSPNIVVRKENKT